MALITQRWGITIATLFAIVSITGAYMLGTGVLKPNTADAISPTTLLQNIANKDSDGDGLPNWEEALYGTNPYKSDSFGLGMTDGEAVARGLIVPKASPIPNTQATSTSGTGSYFDSTQTQGSIDTIFAQTLIQSYANQKKLNNGASLSKQQIANIAQQVMSKINDQTSKILPYKTLSQIKVSGSGSVAMRAYAASVQEAFAKNTISQNEGELTYLQEAMQNSDTRPLERIYAIATLYKNTAISLSQITVPKEVVQAHFELINTYANMANISYKLAELNTNPITTMVALSKYQKGVLGLAKAFTDLESSFQSEGVILTPSDPGYSFVTLMSGIQKQQQ